MNRRNLKILIINRLPLFCFCLFFATQVFGQAKLSCDSLLNFLSKRNDWDQLKEISKVVIELDIESCVLDQQHQDKITSESISNLFKMTGYFIDKKRIPLLMINLNPSLNTSLQDYNSQYLLFWVAESGLLEDEVLNKIKQNFEQGIYYRLLFDYSKKITIEQKKEIEQVFYHPDIEGEYPRIIKRKKWLTALLLATENHSDAENYLLKTVQTLISKIKRKSDRSLIYTYGYDLVHTKNNRLVNYIVDEFLMGDYEWWDWDTGYSDFEAGREILSKVIDTPIFSETRMMEVKVQKQHVRKWFKEHRDNYTFKP